VDVTLYSLKKWASLAGKGNPTALHFLFAEGVLRNAIWKDVARSRSVFLSRTFVKPFLGFADDQLKRMTGTKGRGKKGQRPEIEAKFGYDVKAAMHTLRLLNECKELLSEGTITLPRPERDFLIRVRTGKYSMDKVVAMAQKLFSECEAAAKSSPLPERVDRASISRLLTDSYRKAWDAA
jgi:predicted nucleotidyltransferase